MVGFDDSFPFGASARPIFRGKLAVSFKECHIHLKKGEQKPTFFPIGAGIGDSGLSQCYTNVKMGKENRNEIHHSYIK